MAFPCFASMAAGGALPKDGVRQLLEANCNGY